MEDIKVSYGKPYPLGATCVGPMQVNFAVVINSNKQCGIILYNKKTKLEKRISFCSSNKVGNIRCIQLSNIDINNVEYNYYIENEIVNDSYAKVVLGNDSWGKIPSELRAGIYHDEYDWKKMIK